MDMDAAKPRAGGQESKRLEDIFDMLAQKDGKWIQIRVMPYECVAVGQHWIDIIGSKSKKEVRIPKMCVSFDGNTEEHKKGVKCPYCAVDEKFSPFYLMNVLVRSLQEDAPRKNRLSSAEKKSGIKDPDSESWTPIKVLRVPSSLMRKIQGLKDLNRDKATKKTYSVQHAEFGADINVKYDSKASGTDKYQAQLSDKCALTEEELGFLRYELDAEYIAEQLGRESPKEAAAEFKRMELVDASKFDGSGDDGSGDDGSDDGSEDLGKRSSKSSKGKSSSRSSSKSKSSRSKSSDDGSDDGSDDASGDDSNDGNSGDSSGDSSDDKPSRSSRSSKSKSSRSKSSDDGSGDSSDGSGDDSNDDVSDDAGSSDGSADPDDDGSSDDKPSRNSRSSKSKSCSKVSDDSDDDGSNDAGSGDSNDDSDDKSSRSSRSSKSKSSSSKSSSRSIKSSHSSSKDEGSDDKPSRSSRSSKSKSSRSKSKDASSDDIPF